MTTSPLQTAPVRIGVLGASGQLGASLVDAIEASPRAELVFSTTRADVDFTRLDDLDAWLDARLDQPGAWPLDLVINGRATVLERSAPQLASDLVSCVDRLVRGGRR